MVNPNSNTALTDVLTQPGGAFSGKVVATLIPLAVMSVIPGMTEAKYINLYGKRSIFPPDPFLAKLPPLTAAMSDPEGPLADFCPGYDWAKQLWTALDEAMASDAEIQFMPGDDSATPGTQPNTPSSQWPGIFAPTEGPAGTPGWSKVGSDGETYWYLAFRFIVRLSGVPPWVTVPMNCTLMLRQLLAEPNNIPGVLASIQNQIFTSGGPTTPLA